MALKNLKLVSVAREVTAADPLKRGRDKIVAAIHIQKQAVQADIDGKDFKPVKTAYKRVDGKLQKVTGEVGRFSRWFWFSGGKVYTQVRYGQRPIMLDGKQSTIEAGSKLEDLFKVYDAVVDAVQKGELDAQIKTLGKMPGRKKK